MHLAVTGGAALATAVLTAALFAGDALNRHLKNIALVRIGHVQSAVELRGRYVDASLADRLAKNTGATVAPVLRMPATFLTINADGNETRLDRVNGYGVDARFFALAEKNFFGNEDGRHGGRPCSEKQDDNGRDRARPSKDESSGGPGSVPAVLADEVLVNRRVADALGRATAATGGASDALRVEKFSIFPAEMPLGDRHGDRTVRRTVQLRGELPEASLGRFSLVADQIPPFNLFADRKWLATVADAGNRVNLLLSDAPPSAFSNALRAELKPSDVGVNIRHDTNGVWVVESERIYLDEAHVRALSAATNPPVLTLHYLVDAFATGEGTTAREVPYGFVSALSPTADARLGVIPAGMADDEIVINAWLAKKLNVAVGDKLTLRCRRFESNGKLVPDAMTFKVAHVLDMATVAVERERLPRFPGLTDANSCADWDIGMPMDEANLNDPDNEAYWKEFGATPKAFVTLAAGRMMFGTHYGSAMTARFSPETDKAQIEAILRRADPRDLGLVVRAVHEESLNAASQAMDFRQLFVGMAIVLMVVALMLTGLLAGLGVERRRSEIGVLRAAGFVKRQIVTLLMAESLVPLTVGVLAGMAAGLGGARVLVWALNRFWRGAIASAEVPFDVGLTSAVVAGVTALVLALLAVRGGVRRMRKVQVRELLGEQGEEMEGMVGTKWVMWNMITGMGAAVAALVALVAAGRGAASDAAGMFFFAGLLLMISLICLARVLAQFLGSASDRPVAGPVRAGILNVSRHRGRSLLVMVLLASGCFLTVGTLAMKQDPAAHVERRGSGSGGFAWMVEAALPVAGDQGDGMIRKALGKNTTMMAFRVREGEEAGCLNLNHATQPRLLGVTPEAAMALRSFESEQVADEKTDSVWALLKHPMEDDTIPVLAGDATTVEYGLQTSVGLKDGGVFSYAGEDGTVWKLRVVGALPVRTGVLQGSLIVDESVFTRMYPSVPGHGLWLVQNRNTGSEDVDRLKRAFGRNGGIVTPTPDRLRLLGTVESTYLDMFLVLGGLGVILGAAGVGLVVLRDAAARRAELALLRAMGMSSRVMLVYLASEHLYVLLAGLLAGVLPALVAVQPALRNLRGEMPVGTMSVIIAAMFAAGLAGTALAVWAAVRMQLAGALRGE